MDLASLSPLYEQSGSRASGCTGTPGAPGARPLTAPDRGPPRGSTAPGVRAVSGR